MQNRFVQELISFFKDLYFNLNNGNCLSRIQSPFPFTFRYNEEEWKLNNGLLTDVTFENLCKKSPLQDQLVWLEPVSYDVLSEYCQKVKG